MGAYGPKVKPKALTPSFRGARLLASEPGIQSRAISGFRVRAEEARPGMTVMRYQRDATAVSLSKLASSACSVVSVEVSATPSTRAGRKWR